MLSILCSTGRQSFVPTQAMPPVFSASDRSVPVVCRMNSDSSWFDTASPRRGVETRDQPARIDREEHLFARSPADQLANWAMGSPFLNSIDGLWKMSMP